MLCDTGIVMEIQHVYILKCNEFAPLLFFFQSGGFHRIPWTQSTFNLADSSRPHVTICDTSGVQMSPDESGGVWCELGGQCKVLVQLKISVHRDLIFLNTNDLNSYLSKGMYGSEFLTYLFFKIHQPEKQKIHMNQPAIF
jgi:hypothetical protein